MSISQRQRQSLEERSATFNPDAYDFEPADESPAELDQFYDSLWNYVEMVSGGYTNLLMLDAKGGLGKTHNVKKVLSEELDSDQWTHQKGFTTPVELYKTLYTSRDHDHVLFLDDMSGVTSNTKAVDMLKAATDTQGAENWVEYRTSQTIDHPTYHDVELPNTFNFRGKIIMSFNDTPDNRHFDALKDRASAFYQMSFTYEERLRLIREVAKIPSFSNLPVREQQETAEWIAAVTDPAMEVTLRTLESVCEMRDFAQHEGKPWEKMALDNFNIDHEKYLIIQLREHSDRSIEEQVEYFCQETGRSSSHYYDLLAEIKDDRM